MPRGSNLCYLLIAMLGIVKHAGLSGFCLAVLYLSTTGQALACHDDGMQQYPRSGLQDGSKGY